MYSGLLISKQALLVSPEVVRHVCKVLSVFDQTIDGLYICMVAVQHDFEQL